MNEKSEETGNGVGTTDLLATWSGLFVSTQSSIERRGHRSAMTSLSIVVCLSPSSLLARVQAQVGKVFPR